MNYDELAELYDLQYRDYREDIPFYLRLADKYGGPILELGAGSARLSVELARRGGEVVGLEPSSQMIAQGKARLKQENLTHQVRYKQADMRSFRSDERFPLIIAPFNTLMHAYNLSDQDETLATVRHHLAEGGHFALDLYTPNFNELNVLRSEAIWQNLGAFQNQELFLLQRHDPDRQLLTTDYYLDSTDSEGHLSRKRYQLVQRYYHRFELERMLYQAGFKNLSLYGSFAQERYEATSPYLIVVAS
ncbi:MAG: class I SAM-dependent methyltransferase [Deinococcales bacterium]